MLCLRYKEYNQDGGAHDEKHKYFDKNKYAAKTESQNLLCAV